MFFLGPVVFGVAHLAADVRYLALRRSPPRSLLVVSAVLAVVLTSARAATALHLVRVATVDKLDVLVGVAWVGFSLALARGSANSALIGGPFFVGVAALLVSHARLVGLVLVHAHNVIALLIWLLLFRRRRDWTVLPVLLATALALVLLSGLTLPWTFHSGGMAAMGTRLERLAGWMSPGVSLERGAALATVFVFLQGVHYAVWTGWIPQDALRGEGTPTYRQTVRALLADFGLTAFAVIVALAVSMIGLAIWNVREAVSWYMSLSKFHAWFECAFVAYFLARGGFRPAAEP
jgi:hypothetical protein